MQLNPAPSPHVLHLTSTARIGGAEQLVLKFLKNSHPDRFRHTVAAMEPEGPFLEAVRAAGFEAAGLPSQNPLSPSSRGQLAALLRSGGFAIVHSHGLRAELLARGIAHRAGVTAYVSAIHSPDPWRNRLHAWLDRWSARGGRVDLFIAVSEVARRSRIEREGFPPEKIVVIPNSVDIAEIRRLAGMDEAAIDRVTLAARLGIPVSEGPRLVIVSNLRRMKGHFEAIEAVNRLRSDFPGIQLLLAGEDYSGGRVPEAARQAGVGGHVVYLGFLENPYPLMLLSDVYLMPSYWEGCPTALLEAMALERPIVATTGGGIPEIVRHEREALLVEPGDAEGLAQAIEGLLKRPEEASRLARAGRERVAARYTVERMVERLEETYEKLLIGDLSE